MLLRRLGMRCECVGDGALAIAAVAGAHYDAILMAVKMPVLDGLAAAPVLRAIGFAGPIIALAAPGAASAGVPAGFSARLDRPYETARLAQLLTRTSGHIVAEGQSVPGQSAQAAANAGAGIARGAAPPLSPSDTGFENLPAFAGFRSNFRGALNARLAELRGAAAASDWHSVARQAHTLKGSGGTFGFPGVSELATLIELGARRADAAAVADLLDRLQSHAAFLNRPERGGITQE